MKIFKDFATYNKAIGLSPPMDNDIDVGYYDPPNIIIDSNPVIVEFYRISIKIKYKRKSTPELLPVSAVFFNTPDLIIEPGWDAEPTFTGMHLQLSKKIIEENRFLFKNYLDYGQHEALYLTDD